MLILKIKEKGLYIEIPGALPSRTPAEIDISKCNLAIVDTYLRKNGITNYQILSVSQYENPILKPPKIEDASMDQKLINQRFSNLEKMMAELLEKQQATKSEKSEQITDKLNNLERLATKILESEPKVVEKAATKSVKTNAIKNKKKEPDIEELENTYIPSINISNMKIKSGSKKTIKQNNVDFDDSADLLSRIIGQDD